MSRISPVSLSERVTEIRAASGEYFKALVSRLDMAQLNRTRSPWITAFGGKETDIDVYKRQSKYCAAFALAGCQRCISPVPVYDSRWGDIEKAY